MIDRPIPYGIVRLWGVRGNRRALLAKHRNLITYSGADALARAVAGHAGYQVAGILLEFENLSDPGDPVTVITPARTDSIDTLLALQPPFDFMRSAISAAPVVYGSPPYMTNRVTFYAATQGTVGHLGLPFSYANNSAIRGASLVAMPGGSDVTQDVLIARAPLTKLLLSQGMRVDADWTLEFP